MNDNVNVDDDADEFTTSTFHDPSKRNPNIYRSLYYSHHPHDVNDIFMLILMIR